MSDHLPFIDDPAHVALLEGQRYLVLRPYGEVSSAHAAVQSLVRADSLGFLFRTRHALTSRSRAFPTARRSNTFRRSPPRGPLVCPLCGSRWNGSRSFRLHSRRSSYRCERPLTCSAHSPARGSLQSGAAYPSGPRARCRALTSGFSICRLRTARSLATTTGAACRRSSRRLGYRRWLVSCRTPSSLPSTTVGSIRAACTRSQARRRSRMGRSNTALERTRA